MDARTRRQLLSLSTAFYRAHAEGFDASRGHHPWPGWKRLLDWLPRPDARIDRGGPSVLPADTRSRRSAPLAVLDVGCGNARLASFLAGEGFTLRYLGVDANAALLEAARARLAPELADQVELVEADFLASEVPGESLPSGPFDFVALFGVLHHVPGRDWRRMLVQALAQRLTKGGILALAAWQFAGRERFARRSVAWSELGPVLGEAIDVDELEPGDALLRFGEDPARPPRYCHQVSSDELDRLVEDLAAAGLGCEDLADFRADGVEGDLNRYRVLRRA
jgi:SAM-dependent methyltransferase